MLCIYKSFSSLLSQIEKKIGPRSEEFGDPTVAFCVNLRNLV